MYGALDISTSGMVAQRTRMTVIASNIAHAQTIMNSQGEYAPYLRRAAMLAPDESGGVSVKAVEADATALREAYRPESKFANAAGYVMVPDIDPTVEWVNAMQASRAYEANVAAAETAKSMMAQALRLLA